MLVVPRQISNGECEVGVFASQDTSKSYVPRNDGSEDAHETTSLRVFNYMMKVKMAHASRKIAMAGSTSCSYPPT